MLQVTDIKLTHTPVGPHRCEYVPLPGEVDIVDLLVVGDELREDSGLLDVPDRAGRVDRTGADEVGQLGVPVEGGQRRREVVVLYQ